MALLLRDRRELALLRQCSGRWPSAKLARRLRDVKRLGAGRLAGGIERDPLYPRLGLAQQLLAAALEQLAALIDGDRFLERHLAFLEPLDDRFKLLDGALEGQLRDVGIGLIGHDRFQLRRVRVALSYRGYCSYRHRPAASFRG